MRTTLNIDDHLYRELKRRAVESDRTITELVEEALRASLLAAEEADPAAVPDFPTFDGGDRAGVLPGVDLSDNTGLLDLMEGTSGAAT